MDRIRKFQILNYQIFSIIDKYTNMLPIMEPHIQHIDPPAPEVGDYVTIQNIKPPAQPSAGEENNNNEAQSDRISVQEPDEQDDPDDPDVDYDDEEFRDDNPGESEA